MIEIIPGPITFATLKQAILDASAIAEFRGETIRLAAGGAQVVLDLRALRFIDSMGLGALLALRKCVRRHGGDLSLCAPVGSPIRSLLDRLSLHRLFDLYNEPAEALRRHRLAADQNGAVSEVLRCAANQVSVEGKTNEREPI